MSEKGGRGHRASQRTLGWGGLESDHSSKLGGGEGRMVHSQVGHSEDCGFCSELYEKPLEAFGGRFCILKESLWWLYKKKAMGVGR